MSLKRTLSKSRTYEIGMAYMVHARKLGLLRQNVLLEYNLSSIEWFVLGTVYDARNTGGIRVTDLATRFDVKSTYITAIVNSLKLKGLVSSYTDNNDARVRLIITTSKGMQEVPVIDKKIRDQLEPLLVGKIEDKELDSYLHTLKRLAHEFDPAHK